MICINARNLGVHVTGVQRYTRKIYEEWMALNCESRLISPSKPVHGLVGHLWEQFCLPYQVKSADTLWSPSNTGPLVVKNQVVTIHDTVPFDHPEWLNKNFVAWYQFIQPKLVKSASKIITISEFSKARIMHHLNVPEHKIEVVYNGVDVALHQQTIPLNDLQLPFSRYLLSVGSIEPRKNISRLVQAWLKIKDHVDDDLGLIIVGAQGISRVFEAVGSLDSLSAQRERVYFTGHVTDQVLHSLYKYASGFCYPSIYEGFGLPPLEAMCYGIPVLTSNTTAMKELCSSSAILIDPLSVDNIADGLLGLLSDNNHSRIERGLALSAALTWKKCAEQTLSVIHG